MYWGGGREISRCLLRENVKNERERGKILQKDEERVNIIQLWQGKISVSVGERERIEFWKR
jgi:hypothetical protein